MAEVRPPIDTEKCVVAVSSQVLLNLKDATDIYEDGKNLKDYLKEMIRQEEDPKVSPLKAGTGWVFLQSLKAVKLGDLEAFEIVLITRHHVQAGARLIKSMRYHGIEIDRASFCDPAKIIPQLQIFDTDLFLSTNENLLTQVVQQGIPAALMVAQSGQTAVTMLTIAFQENSAVDKTLIFEKFVEKIGKIKIRFSGGNNQIKTYLLTTRKKETVMESLDYGMFKYLKLKQQDIRTYDGSCASEEKILKEILPSIYFCFTDNRRDQAKDEWEGVFKAKIWQ